MDAKFFSMINRGMQISRCCIPERFVGPRIYYVPPYAGSGMLLSFSSLFYATSPCVAGRSFFNKPASLLLPKAVHRPVL